MWMIILVLRLTDFCAKPLTDDNALKIEIFCHLLSVVQELLQKKLQFSPIFFSESWIYWAFVS